MLVTPCRTVLGIVGRTNADRSEWLCTSTKPGDSTAPRASIIRAASGGSSRPTAAIRSRSTPTHPDTPGVPVPSMTVAFATTRSIGATRYRAGRSSVGKEDPERRAAAVARLDPRAPVVKLGEPSNEREPDANARRVPAGRTGPLLERFEDRLADLVRDPRSGVVDADLDAAVDRTRPDQHVCLGRGVPERVRDEVLDDALHLGAVDV